MATKYITLEEAAARLKMGTDQLKKLRADGEIRGFADRGTWKFRDVDIDEYARKVQGDSDPDFPAISDDDFFNTVSGDMGSDSDVRLVPDQSSAAYKVSDEDSDSDVQLVDSSMKIASPIKSELEKPSSTIRPDSPALEDDSKLKLHDSGANWARVSDSDMRIVQTSKGSSGKNEIAPDSDIKIEESSPAWKVVESSDSTSIAKRPSASDVTLRNDPDADSDVKLVQGSAVSKLDDSDSDVRLVGDSSKIRKPGSGESDIKLVSDLADSDSDVKLHPAQSSIARPASKFDVDDDSGLTIELDEDSVLVNQQSGFGKPGIDSGISLAGDSGISLELASDSGISLMDEDSNYSQIASDSGISLEPVDESGFTLPPLSDDDMGGTIPMLNLSSDDDDDRRSDKTIELSADDDVFNLTSDEDDSHDTTNVIMFDDDDSSTKKGSFIQDSALYTDELAEDGEESVFDLSSVDEDMGEEFDADDLELSDDMIGEDDQLDVFEAEEGDFEDGFESGESQPSLSSGGRQVAYVAAAAPWGAGTISLLAISSLMMMFCTLLMFDVVRSMWSLDSPMPSTSMLLDLMTSMGL